MSRLKILFQSVLISTALLVVGCKGVVGGNFESSSAIDTDLAKAPIEIPNFDEVDLITPETVVKSPSAEKAPLEEEVSSEFNFSLLPEDKNYICNQQDRVELLDSEGFCDSLGKKDIPHSEFLLRKAKPGHYKVSLFFPNGKSVIEKHFTHTSDLYLSIKAKHNSLGKVRSVSASYLSNDNMTSEQNYKKLDIQSLLNNRNRKDVFTLEQLTHELHFARGGEVIVIRRNIHGYIKEFRSKDKYSSRVYVVGMLDNGQAPHLDRAIWSGLENLTITNLKVNRKNVKLSKYGFSTEYAWRVKNSKNIRMTGLHFFGSDDGLALLAKNSIKGVFNDPRGAFIRDSEEVFVDHNLFENLFHAIEFQNMNGLYAVSNRADKITSDMFSGGGLKNGLFESNLSLTKMPVHYTYNGRKEYTHSDMIQLYTTSQKQANENITIRNNIALAGDAPVNNKLSAGWQCFFTRDESGDQSAAKSLPYRNVRIYNNLCVSNQHHGVTIGRGVDNYVASNMILELQGSSDKVTAGIRINSNVGTKVLNNISKQMIRVNSFELDFKNNRELDRHNQWIKEFYKNHIGTRKVLVPLRGLASAGTFNNFGQTFNVKSLSKVPFE